MIFESRYPTAEIPGKDILSFIFDDWRFSWDRPLFIDADNPSHVITAKQLVSLTRRVGRGLREGAGVRPDDVVLLCSANRIDIPALVLGVMCAGAAVSGANPTFTVSELCYQIEDCEAKAIFAAEDTLDKILECCKVLNIPESRVFVLSLSKGPKNGVRTLGDLLGYGEMDWDRLTTKEQTQKRLAALNYSSGTTGLPKGCMISVYNMVAHAVQNLKHREEGKRKLRELGEVPPESETGLAYVPFYHAMGQQHFCLTGVKNGDTTYVMNAFSFPALLSFIPRYRITSIPTVPPIVVGLAKHPLVRETDFSSVRSLYCGAAPVGADLQAQAEEAINVKRDKSLRRLKIQQVWGMSEATLGATSFAMSEYDPEVSGVGFLMCNMSMKLVDDDGREVGYDQPGEIYLKGPNIFAGYWKKAEATKTAFTEDGFYKTGDIGVVRRKTGILHIVDRKKELIKVKGYQVAPAELENLLMKNPDVLDAAVIGIIGEGTEHPRAYIVSARPDVSAKSIQEYIETRVAKYKHLTGGVVFVDVIPKSTSGKILRRELREMAKKEAVVKAKL